MAEQQQNPGLMAAGVPDEFKGLRACLRCALIKTYTQFYDDGCENCPFLEMQEQERRIEECTTAYFEGMISLLDPAKSWVAKWQQIGQNAPGIYAIEVVGELPEDAMDYCEQYGVLCRADINKSK